MTHGINREVRRHRTNHRRFAYISRRRSLARSYGDLPLFDSESIGTTGGTFYNGMVDLAGYYYCYRTHYSHWGPAVVSAATVPRSIGDNRRIARYCIATTTRTPLFSRLPENTTRYKHTTLQCCRSFWKILRPSTKPKPGKPLRSSVTFAADPFRRIAAVSYPAPRTFLRHVQPQSHTNACTTLIANRINEPLLSLTLQSLLSLTVARHSNSSSPPCDGPPLRSS